MWQLAGAQIKKFNHDIAYRHSGSVARILLRHSQPARQPPYCYMPSALGLSLQLDLTLTLTCHVKVPAAATNIFTCSFMSPPA